MKTFIENNFYDLKPNDIRSRIIENYKNLNLNFKKCIIYGASKEAKIFIKECKKNNITIDGVIDDHKYGQWFEGYAVLRSLETINKTYSPIIVCTQKFVFVINKLNALGFKNAFPLFLLHILYPKKFLVHPFYKDWINELYINKKKYAKVEKVFKEKKSKQTWKHLLFFKYSFNIKYLSPVISFGDDYFPKDLDSKISKKEIFIDGGGWVGDTTDIFLNKYKKYKHIFIYEPGKFALSKLRNKYKNKKITIKKVAVGDRNSKINFYDTRDPSSTKIKKKYQKPYKVRVEPIDSLGIKNENITLKLNVEGAEKNALKGAKRTIIENNTNLAICLAHRPSDIVNLIEYVTLLGKKFKYYLRLHDYGITQLVLYAIDQNRNSKKLNKY